MQFNLQTGSHTVSALQYHFVTVTKYRADILTEELEERIGEIANDTAEDFDVEIKSVDGWSDHIHSLFTTEPTTALPMFINSLKGVTSQRTSQEFPEVKQPLDDSCRHPGYFLATTGQVRIDVLKEYVENQ